MGHFVENKVGAQKQILCVFANISKEELHEKINQVIINKLKEISNGINTR